MSSDGIYFVVSERDADLVGTDLGADGYWFHGEVVLDGRAGERYEASAFVSAYGDVSFADSLDQWADQDLIDLMEDDIGLIGRVQAAIKRALTR